MYYPISVFYRRTLKLKTERIEEVNGKFYAVNGQKSSYGDSFNSKHDFVKGSDTFYWLNSFEEEHLLFLHKYLIPSPK